MLVFGSGKQVESYTIIWSLYQIFSGWIYHSYLGTFTGLVRAARMLKRTPFLIFHHRTLQRRQKLKGLHNSTSPNTANFFSPSRRLINQDKKIKQHQENNKHYFLHFNLS